MNRCHACLNKVATDNQAWPAASLQALSMKVAGLRVACAECGGAVSADGALSFGAMCARAAAMADQA